VGRKAKREGLVMSSCQGSGVLWGVLRVGEDIEFKVRERGGMSGLRTGP